MTANFVCIQNDRFLPKNLKTQIFLLSADLVEYHHLVLWDRLQRHQASSGDVGECLTARLIRFYFFGIFSGRTLLGITEEHPGGLRTEAYLLEYIAGVFGCCRLLRRVD